MDTEIKRTIDKRRKRTPKNLDYEDIIVIKSDPQAGRNALQIDASGPMIFVEYADPNRNVVRYFDPKTERYGRASIENVKLINV